MILLGRPIAQKIEGGLKKKKSPKNLLVIQVGDDETSNLYIRKKSELASELGVKLELQKFPNEISEAKLIEAIHQANFDETVGAIVVQMPLPAGFDRDKIALEVAKEKDIDGFHYILAGGGNHIPPTVLAIDEIVKYYRPEALDKNILIVGGGFLVGQPLYRYWRDKGLNIQILKKDDSQYEQKLQANDLVVVATGGGRRFSYRDFKPGAVVIDASTMSENKKIIGDVDKTDWPDDIDLAPVPGGIGPLTVALLLRNFFE